MELSKVISIAGKPGLYKVVGQMKNGVIVEGLDDKKRFPAYSTSKVSALVDISIYTEEEEVALFEVYMNFFKKYDGKALEYNEADNDSMRNLLEEVLPTFDKERVYISDIKKMLKWYNNLIATGMMTAEAVTEIEKALNPDEVEEAVEVTEEAVAAPKKEAKKSAKLKSDNKAIPAAGKAVPKNEKPVKQAAKKAATQTKAAGRGN